jgi:hypothetical protein
MKHFTQISKFAAMAGVAAIGISLYACEEKGKADGKALEGNWKGEKHLAFLGENGEVDGWDYFNYTIKGDTIIATWEDRGNKVVKSSFKIEGDELTITSSEEEDPIAGKYKRYQRYIPPKPDKKTEELTKSNAKAIVGKWKEAGSGGTAVFQACTYGESDGVCYGNYTTPAGDFFSYAIRGYLIISGPDAIDYDQLDPNKSPYKLVIKDDKMTWEANWGSEYTITYERATDATATKQRSLEETINAIIFAYSNKDVKTLNSFISNDFGIGIISRPGSTNLLYIYKELDNEFSFCGKIGGKKAIRFGELPSYDCEKWDKPSGIYSAESPSELASLAKITNEFVGDVIISEKEIKKLKEIEGETNKVIANGGEECVFAFYLAYLNNKWHLVAIDKAIDNCDA